MNITMKTCGDWLFYGGLIGALGAAISTGVYGKKVGAENLNWKNCSIIIVIFTLPTIVLPILLMPGVSFFEKCGVVLALGAFGAVRYYATTKGQEAVAELRQIKDRDKMNNKGDPPDKESLR